jgi:Zn-dependent protease with chaperone function
MSAPAPAYAKSPCNECGLNIEFPNEMSGSVIDCPHCQQKTQLFVPEPDLTISEPSSSINAPDLLAAFAGRVPKTPVSFLYRIGLIIVAVTMLVLPLIYFALIGVAAWATYFWATHFTFLFTSGGGGRAYILKVAFYAAPIFAGIVLVLFMVKPLFARRPKQAQPLALSPGAEPTLFAFIAKICETVGAPFPKRIDLDCNLNASASFRRGAWSLFGNDLVLTIGLPLVAALTIKEFAGVLAHEFGHFTQGFGMRLTYIIRSVNGWFARLVYERDSWDLLLEELAETESSALAIVVGCARLAVWTSRRILQLLMIIGHGIGCFMLRQMEYDADSYEIKLAGSEAFETTARRMHVLAHVLDSSYKDMRVGLTNNRELPENLPNYVLHHDSRLQPAQRSKFEDTMGLEASGIFDTHPSNGDRIGRARQANDPGVFHFDGPAAALFSNFDVPAKQVTMLHYAEDLGLPMGQFNLVPLKKDLVAQSGFTESARALSSVPLKVRLKGE